MSQLARKTEELPPQEIDGRPVGYWVEDYFHEYENLAIFSDACKYAGVVPSTVAGWRKTHPEFKEREQETKAIVLDKVRKELLRRSIDGWVEPIYHDGKLVGAKTVYDNKLLMFVAERLMREEYHLASKLEVDNTTTVRFDFRLGERDDEVVEIEEGDVQELEPGVLELEPEFDEQTEGKE